jgi:hypothetical protein
MLNDYIVKDLLLPKNDRKLIEAKKGMKTFKLLNLLIYYIIIF